MRGANEELSSNSEQLMPNVHPGGCTPPCHWGSAPQRQLKTALKNVYLPTVFCSEYYRYPTWGACLSNEFHRTNTQRWRETGVKERQGWRKDRHPPIYMKWVSLHLCQKPHWLPQPSEWQHLQTPEPVRWLWATRCPQVSFQTEHPPHVRHCMKPATVFFQLGQDLEGAWSNPRGLSPPQNTAV